MLKNYIAAKLRWYLILMIYLDFVTFDESINFIKDFT